MTMFVDNFDPSTYLWILQELDFPYIEVEWNVLRDRAFAKDAQKMNGMSVIGKYLAKMRLARWKDYGWADSERILKEQREKEIAEAKIREEYTKIMAEREAVKAAERKRQEKIEAAREIINDVASAPKMSEAQRKTITPVEQLYAETADTTSNFDVITGKPTENPYETYFDQDYLSEEDLPDPASSLTNSDKIMLAMKWGRFYKPSEWVEMEKKYSEMCKSFEINDSDTKSSLILICKTWLKLNSAIDSGDLEGYQKLSRVYESMRKSAKFTAVQNKEDKGDFIDSIGQLVEICERQGFIPRYVTDIPQDKVDKTLKDMNNYTRQLIIKDLGLGQKIEDQLKKIQIKSELAQAEAAKEKDEFTIEDKDFFEYSNLASEAREHDQEVLNNGT